MAKELQSSYTPGMAAYLYTWLKDVSTGKIWNPLIGTPAFVTPANTPATYALTVNEDVLPGEYSTDMPAGIPAGLYRYEVRKKPTAIATPSVNDLLVWNDFMPWDGTKPSVPTVSVVYGMTGAKLATFTSKDVDNVTPLSGVAVYISSDIAGTLRSQVQISDDVGLTHWMLDVGTAYVWEARYDRLYANNPIVINVT